MEFKKILNINVKLISAVRHQCKRETWKVNGYKDINEKNRRMQMKADLSEEEDIKNLVLNQVMVVLEIIKKQKENGKKFSAANDNDFYISLHSHHIYIVKYYMVIENDA